MPSQSEDDDLVERLVLYPAGIVLALIVSLAVAWLLAVSLTFLGSPPWLAEAAAGFFAAAAFILVGAYVAASRGLAFPLLLFAVGAFLSWFLLRGIVRDISPYHGILELACTYVGGGGGVFLFLTHFRRRVGRASIAALAFVVAAAVFAASAEALLRPQYGSGGLVYGPNGETQPVRFVWLDGHTSAAIWSPKANASLLTEAVENGRIEIETGSGPLTAAATQIRDSEELHRIRVVAEASMADRIKWERDHGFVPAFLTSRYRAMQLPPGPVLRAEMRGQADD